MATASLFKRLTQRGWPHAFFDIDLVDLSIADSKYSGVLTPSSEVDAPKIGISDQFLAHAAVYDQKYEHANPVAVLLKRAFELTHFQQSGRLEVLDIGTGSGKNSIIPLRGLFPNARFIATDLSPDLLAILLGHADRSGFRDHVTCVCTDAMESHFVPGRFDVVTGIAILHHLIDPTRALRAAHTALRKDGVAVFFDPFEGFALLKIIFSLILDRAQACPGEVDEDVLQFLKAMRTDIEARTGSDKSADRFRHMDDKWLFTRTFVEREAKNAGFRDVHILAKDTTDTAIRSYISDLLRLGLGKSQEALPAWAWSYVDLVENSLSSEMKNDLVFEGAIVLVK
ncbi:class I SAM-dependent methyltransferase [Achromobacter denitrificans]|uniref:class I SAM-dependent methyltransferase n=1 Tax=Achromobacter denitrificans TaxID=32002 RepID=UPI003D042789